MKALWTLLFLDKRDCKCGSENDEDDVFTTSLSVSYSSVDKYWEIMLHSFTVSSVAFFSLSPRFLYLFHKTSTLSLSSQKKKKKPPFHSRLDTFFVLSLHTSFFSEHYDKHVSSMSVTLSSCYLQLSHLYSLSLYLCMYLSVCRKSPYLRHRAFYNTNTCNHAIFSIKMLLFCNCAQ